MIQEELAKLPEDVSEAEKLRVIEAAEEEAALNPEFGRRVASSHSHPPHPNPSYEPPPPPPAFFNLTRCLFSKPYHQ